MPSFLADTNVLLRSVDPLSPQHRAASQAIGHTLSRGNQVYLTAQNLVEFWAVVTRPIAANGLGWTVERAATEVATLRSQFPLLLETPDIFPQWLELVKNHHLAGKRVHDARLAAVMLVHGVTHLLTFNDDHFRIFPDLVVINPSRLVPGPQ